MATAETHTINERLDAISQVEEFVNLIHNVGDAIYVNADDEVVSYKIKYIDLSLRAAIWIKSTNQAEKYTSGNVIQDIKRLIIGADKFSITLEFNGKESVTND